LAEVPGEMTQEVADAVHLGPRPPTELLVGQLIQAVFNDRQGGGILLADC
jgi:hypothetical protein